MNKLFRKIFLLSLFLFQPTLFADVSNIGVYVSDVSANEAAGTMTFTVSVDELPLSLFSSVRVDYATIDGSATAGADYTEKTSGFFSAIWFTPSSPLSKTLKG